MNRNESDMNRLIVYGVLLVMVLLLAPGKLHARYLNTDTGRFQTMDTFEGSQSDPISLHKYLYCQGNPVDNIDPSGHDIEGLLAFMDFSGMLAQIGLPVASKVTEEAVAVERQPASSFRLSPQGLQLIASIEEFRARIYPDPAGYDTIGFGHKLTAGEQAKYANGIAWDRGMDLLWTDIGSAQRIIGSAVTATLNQYEDDALVSFTFNVGEGNLRGSTLLTKVNQRDYDGASDEFPRWIYAGGRILPGLVTRRTKEQILFRGEVWRFRSELGFNPY